MKRIFICVACAVALLFGVAIAEDVTIVASGECGKDGDNVAWELDSSGTLTISGEGEMADYDSTSSPWSRNEYIKTVAIQEGVTSIGKFAFNYCNNIINIIIPEGLIKINDYAFYECNSLYAVFVDSLECWLNIYFSGQYSSPFFCSEYDGKLYISRKLVTDLIIPEGIKQINAYAFYGCSNLQSIVIVDGVASIGDYAFSECNNLRSITIPDSVTGIGVRAFNNCTSLNDIIIPGEINAVKSETFSNCKSLNSVSILKGVKLIDFRAFYNCSSLRYVTIPEGLTTIGEESFVNCRNLRSITIPESVSSIKSWAFDNCYSLKKIMFLGNRMPNLINCAFSGSPTIYCREYSEVDYWAANNGYDCIYIDNMDPNTPISIDLPQNMKFVLGEHKIVHATLFPQMDESRITWESSDPSVVSVDNGMFIANGIGKTTIIASYNGISSQTQVTVYVPLESFEISESEIWLAPGDTAQLNICNIQPVEATVILSWRNSDSSVISMNSNGGIIAHNPGDATVTAVSYNGIVRTCLVHVYCPVTVIETEKIMLPASIKTIETDAFAEDRFVCVVIPEGCKSIGSGVFRNCEELQFVEIPASVESIDESAFDGCDDLTIITVPASEAESFAKKHNIACCTDDLN